jgi:hypothetical protein
MSRSLSSKDNQPISAPDHLNQSDLDDLPSKSNNNPMLVGKGSNASDNATLRSPQTILRLQRDYGNAAVRRLLADSSTNIQRQQGGGPTPVPRRLQQQNPLIHSVEGPTLEPNRLGSYIWRVFFELPQPANGDGYIIQKVFRYSEDLETNQLVPQSPPYWELWPVRAGQTFTEDHLSGGAWDDSYQFQYLSRNIKHGRNCHRGIARFYEGPLPPEFGSREIAGQMIETRPAIWNGQGTQHDATATWDIRPGQPHYNRFTGVAGGNIYRLP